MVFMELIEDQYSLTKPIRTFIFLSLCVSIGLFVFVLLMYAVLYMATSSGFETLASTVEDNNERERIDDNDEFEDV